MALSPSPKRYSVDVTLALVPTTRAFMRQIRTLLMLFRRKCGRKQTVDLAVYSNRCFLPLSVLLSRSSRCRPGVGSFSIFASTRNRHVRSFLPTACSCKPEVCGGCGNVVRRRSTVPVVRIASSSFRRLLLIYFRRKLKLIRFSELNVTSFLLLARLNIV